MKSIRSRLIILFLPAVLVPALLCSILYHSSYKQTIVQQISQARQNSLRLIANNVGAVVESASSISDLCYYDEVLVQTLLRDELNASEILQARSHIIDTYTRYYHAFSNVGVPFYIAVYATNGLEYCTLSNPEQYNYEKITKTSWFSFHENQNNDKFIIPIYNDYSKNGEDNYVIALVRLIRDSEGYCRGSIMVCVPCDSIRASFSDIISEENRIYLLDSLMCVISSSDKHATGSLPLETETHRFISSSLDYSIVSHGDGVKYLVSKYWLQDYNWYLLEEVPLNSLLVSLNATSRNMLIITFLLTAVFSLVVIFFSNSVSKPLGDFCRALDSTNETTLNQNFTVRGYREINDLNEKFNALLLRVQLLIADVQQKEHDIHQAELKQLKLQINPHFIYNTLFSIKCMIEMKNNREASEMISILSSILNTTLRTEQELRPLSDCIALAVQYYKLQKIRYSRSIQICIESDECLNSCLFPAFTLQPLIENAIEHGLQSDGTPLTITLHTYLDADGLNVLICDDGRGISSERLAELRIRLASGASNDKGIGIVNVNARIRHLFGDDYGLKIDGRPNQGAVMHITVPEIYKQEDAKYVSHSDCR